MCEEGWRCLHSVCPSPGRARALSPLHFTRTDVAAAPSSSRGAAAAEERRRRRRRRQDDVKREASRIEFLRANGAPLMAARLTSPHQRAQGLHDSPAGCAPKPLHSKTSGWRLWLGGFQGEPLQRALSVRRARERIARGTCLEPLCSLARSLAPALAVQLGHECARALSRYPCSHPARVLEAAAVVAALRAVSRAVSRQ